MTFRKNRLGSLALGAAFFAAACAGSKLNDVGDIDGTGATAGTEAGAAAGTEAGAAAGTAAGGKGAKPAPSTAGTNGVVPGSNAGSGGSTGVVPGGAGYPPEPPEGGGPSVLVEELECDGCELLAEGGDIREIAATEDRVYWIEYDTQDGLGNYEDNGRLLSVSQDGGEPAVIASDLQGPIGLEIGDDYAYVLVEHSSAPKGETELLRVPLDGGATQVLEPIDPDLGAISNHDGVYDWFHRYFVMNGGVAYWVEGNSIVRLSETGTDPLEILYNDLPTIFAITGDESQIFFMDREGLKTLPYAGGQPTLLKGFSSPELFPAYYQLSVAGDYLYAIDNLGLELYVVRMPKTGGAWKRIGKSNGPAHLKVDGSSYFTDPAAMSRGQYVGASLVQTNLIDSSLVTTLAKSPPPEGSDYWRAWDVAPEWVYFGWESKLYRAPRAD